MTVAFASNTSSLHSTNSALSTNIRCANDAYLALSGEEGDDDALVDGGLSDFATIAVKSPPEGLSRGVRFLDGTTRRSICFNGVSRRFLSGGGPWCAVTGSKFVDERVLSVRFG